MSRQPDALRLADELSARCKATATGLRFDGTLAYSAAELRLQQKQIEQLKTSLREAAEEKRALEAEVQRLSKNSTRMDAVVATYAVGDLQVERCLRRVGPKQTATYWAIRRDGFALNKQGEWEYEPMPSSRTDEFLDRCRFDSAHSAIAAAKSKRDQEAQ